ncbi:uncharacterized protein EAE97_011443 [Botrytis byssoidea]|uniref:Uncharacterized protein n=1 Tax=Botrytis byssoidea TaxID=139641 RepID=A0A9P5LQS5_9HELO|nr:uncharacterized protein EAE97_011443 [Botrytis byssoidea]KAF7920550.1 hypothetical protein EAE97_011443 [Botrytis byssoidea]
MISIHLMKIIISFILIAFAPAAVIGSSGPQESSKSVSIFSAGISTILVFETHSGFFKDKCAQLATYTTPTQIAGSTYTGIFAGCCFLLLDEAGSCQDNPSCRPAYVTKTVSYYLKNDGPEAPSKTDPPPIIGNPTETSAPSSSAGNGMMPANLMLMIFFLCCRSSEWNGAFILWLDKSIENGESILDRRVLGCCVDRRIAEV